MKIINKLLRYKNPLIFLQIAGAALKISFMSFKKGPSAALALIPAVSANAKKTDRSKDRDKIIRYVNLYFFIRKRLGIGYTCLERSMLLCYMLRKSGIKAEIDFGAKKTNGKLEGHCWLSQDRSQAKRYQTIFRYP